MAGSQGIQQGPRVLIIAIALAVAFAASVQAQTPSLPNPTPPVGFRLGRRWAGDVRPANRSCSFLLCR